MHIKDQAICIKKIDYSDSSQILTLFCRDSGKISVMAKGSKRSKSSFGSPINLFSVGEAVYIPPANGASLAILAEFDHLPLFTRLSNNLLTISGATVMCELINLLTHEYDPNRGIYDKFSTFLADLSEGGSRQHCLALIIIFELGLLTELGTAIPMKNCGNCGRNLMGNLEIYFCAETGGFICRDCEMSFSDKFKAPPKIVEAITNPQKLETIDEKSLWEIEKLLIHHFAYTLGKMPKTASFFLSQNNFGKF